MYKRILKVLLTVVLLFLMILNTVMVVFAQESGSTNTQKSDYNPENYTSSRELIVDAVHNAFLNRQENLIIKFATDVAYDGNGLRDEYLSWIEDALVESGKSDEGDYMRLHCRGYKTSNITAWTTNYVTYYYTIPFTFEYYSTKQHEDAVTEEISKVVQSFGFTADTTDKEKCDVIYKYITETVRYDYAHSDDADYLLQYSAYAALVNKTAVCNGYATLFYRLARECGLQVRAVTGLSYGESHAWNIVKLGDLYYYLDATWDEGNSEYKYYLKGSDEFLNHTLDKEYQTEAFLTKHPISKISYEREGIDEACKDGHTFDNDCDATCNVCGMVRTVYPHVYDDENDRFCNICGANREYAYDRKITTDQKLTLTFTARQYFDVVLSNDYTVQMTDIKVETDNSNGVTTYTITTVIVPKKPGYVTFKMLDGKGNILAESVLLVEEGEHQMYSEGVVRQPTCNQEGIEKQVCIFCGLVKEIGIPKLAHIYDDTCDEYCNVCGSLRGNTSHTYDNGCDTTCNVCGDVRSVAHDYEWKIDKAETCGTNGLKHQECTVCGAKQNENTIISANGRHVYDGEADDQCNVCNHLRSEHTHIYDNDCDTKCNECGEARNITHILSWVIDVYATCAATGVKHQECIVCGIRRNENTAIPVLTSHIYDDPCDAECNLCGGIREIKHNYKITTDQTISLTYSSAKDFEFVVLDETVAKIANLNTTYDANTAEKTVVATISPLKPGRVAVRVVDLQGKILAQSIVLIEEGKHQMKLVEIITTATCTEDGKEKHICKFCGFAEETVISKTGHKYSNNCDTTCNICGGERVVNHDYKWIIDKTETCGEFGVKHQECMLCGFKQNENTAIPLSSVHTYDDACDTFCNICGFERSIKYDQVVSVGEKIILKFSSSVDFDFVLSDETIAQITDKKFTYTNENGVIVKTTTANITTLKPGYVIIKIITSSGVSLAESVLLVEKGEHQYSHIADKYCNICGEEREVTGEHLVEEDGKMYHYIDGEKSNVTDLVKADGTWYYIENGVWASKVDTLHKINGKWFLIKGGIWKATTGLVEYKGKTFYVVGGKWNSDVTDLKKVDGKWYYIQYGKWNQSIDTLHKINGKWFLIKKGMWTATTGLVEYQGKTFYVVGGKWNSQETLYKKDGKLYAIKGGKWYTGKSTLKYNGKIYYVNGGYAQISFTGKVKIGSKTYTVKKGIIQ